MQTITIGGAWVNDAGSELVIADVDGALTGVYRTALGRADHRKEYPLVGWCNGRCLGFTVSWAPDSDSVTAWTALLHDEELHTVWTLVRTQAFTKGEAGITEREAAPWEAFTVQTSRFRRQA
ncbi:MAG: hypothetical protein JWR10_2614 [Rubritepida sp.]|nr:hypothetical protein [Rubritepida sp.]